MNHDQDPLAIIAQSYKTMAETQQILAQTNLRLEATQQYLAESQRRLEDTHRFGLRVQTFALTLIGLSLVGLGVLLWLGFSHSAEHAAQTQALLELLRRLTP